MTQSPSPAPQAHGAASTPDAQYELLEPLGRGGMARVYRARDRVTGREVALKQLTAARSEREKSLIASLFEREFHTLAQLRHPHVIAVYDYGILGDGSPFYTMELLDGGDVSKLAPLPWKRACALFFEVCSSLALLHSRRLIHRDITPVNIRCAHGGRAKLIDFGALVAMGASGIDVVGTPAFVAPENLHRLALDARTDLFSLGATLYFALTGSLPYPARTFKDVVTAWNGKVRPPSEVVPGIPAALDDLVLSLISIEPVLRPASAFDVMHLLATIGGLTPDESEAVSRAYLATPSLVGREEVMDQLRQSLLASRLSRSKALLLDGPSGIGRSRLLDACILEAKTLGFTVLRATATDERHLFSSVQALAQQLLEAGLAEEQATALLAPDVTVDDSRPAPARRKLRDLSDPALHAADVQHILVEQLRAGSKARALLIAVDDIHRIDARSAAVLAALLDDSARGSLCAVFTADSDAGASAPLRALARGSSALHVSPLSAAETRALLASVFGEVANLDLLAREVHAVTEGVPRQCMDVAQHLVDRGLIRYAAGAWALPERLSAGDLPRSTADAIAVRIDQLSPNARWFAEALALAFAERLTGSQCHALRSDLSPERVESALTELLTCGAALSHAHEYTLPNRLWTEALAHGLDASRTEERHRALAAMYESCCRVAFIYHAFAGGLDESGLQALAELNEGYAKQLDVAQVLEDRVDKMMSCYPRALAAAERLGRSARFVNELRRWNFAGDVLLEDAGVPESAQKWCAQLRHDSGLDLYESDPDRSDPMQRLMRALQGAQARHLATPEDQRVYNVEEALRLLAEYVVLGIAFGGRTHDAALMRSLPALLEPFAPLAPVLDAIWRNAQASYLVQGEGRFVLGHLRWLEVFQKLEALDRHAMPYVSSIASAVAFAIGLMEAQLGLPSANDWADRLDREPAQRIAALQLRRIVRLEQGDMRGAERFRRQAELLALEGRAPQMFKSLLAVELTACTDARDLSGIQDVIERMRPIAARFPGWVTNLQYAEACFHLVRGDYQAARDQCLRCIAHAAPGADGVSNHMMMWNAAMLCLAEATLGLGNPTEAREILDQLEATHRSYGEQEQIAEPVRVRALTEARLGIPGAAQRLEATIALQNKLGITGLRLGINYEARALIAVWQRDTETFERYAALTAHEYRYGAGSALGARYERLLNEARRHGVRAIASPLPAAEHTEPNMLLTRELRSTVQRSMSREINTEGRAQAALQLLCAARGVQAGQLYLNSKDGLRLAASIGMSAPLPELNALEAFLERAIARADDLDDMITGELTQQANSEPKTLVRMGAVDVEAIPLSCVVDGMPRFPGVVVLGRGERGVDELRERQLLSTLAAHFIEDLAPER